MAAAFAPIAEAPVPDRLAALLDTTVVALTPRRPAPRWWLAGSGRGVAGGGRAGQGHFWQPGPVAGTDRIVASAPAREGARHAARLPRPAKRGVVVSFRDASGAYCRVFSAHAADGIACRESGALGAPPARFGRESRDAGRLSPGGIGEPAGDGGGAGHDGGRPLAADAERAARDAGWR
ncbi:MAG: hypothetical protein WDN24_06280 [Sphingomonas sp.]